MENPRILVVDDNPAMRKGLSLRLRSYGYDVLLAEDGISATAAAVTEQPDLMILDLGLPRGDGFVVMDRLQRNGRLSRIPVIVLTGRELAGNRDRALQAGAAAFFQKPVEDCILLGAVRQALDVFRAPSTLPTSGREPAATPSLCSTEETTE
jgi:CheY-like chemotaxis protein